METTEFAGVSTEELIMHGLTRKERTSMEVEALQRLRIAVDQNEKLTVRIEVLEDKREL